MKKNFSLVLGGGAARGFAHIGVFRTLEELHIYPSEIAGTSMGAVIAALSVLGYSSQQMQEIATQTAMMKLIDLDFKKGLIQGNRVMKYLRKYIGESTFDDTRIPLSIVATDINTGEEIIYREGKILDAIRASISIPGVFSPFKYDGRELVDGGITENLPISAIRSLDPIVAVSVLNTEQKTKIKKSILFPNGTLFSNSYMIMRKAVSIMMHQNELKSLTLRKDIMLIRPGLPDIDYYHFNQSAQMIEEGYKESYKILASY